MTCPDPETLAAYAERALPLPQREGVEAHAAACRDCRQALRLLFLQPRPSGAVARGLRPGVLQYSAAAALLLAVSLPFVSGDRGEVAKPEAPTPPVSAPAWPSGADRPIPESGIALQGIEATPAPGARALLGRTHEGEPRLSLQAGGVWVRASRVLPLRIETPAAVLRLEGASVWASLEGLSGVCSLRVVLLAGELTWRDDVGVEHPLSPGRILSIGNGGAVELSDAGGEPAALLARWAQCRAGSAGWRDLLAGGVTLSPASPACWGKGLDGGRYRLRVLLEGRDVSTEVALVLPTPAGPRQWTVLLPSRGAGPRADLEILCDGTVIRACLDGIPVLECATGEAGRLLEAAPAGAADGWGVRSWGGPVRVVSVRARSQGAGDLL